ncbi:MAG: nucleotide disphospho-sugar-binding domain-containing protein [Actinomycetota bacterium]
MGADQPMNAVRIEALGVGRMLDAIGSTPEDIQGAVTQVLDDLTYRRAAELVRDEVAALPGPEHAVNLIEALRTT